MEDYKYEDLTVVGPAQYVPPMEANYQPIKPYFKIKSANAWLWPVNYTDIHVRGCVETDIHVRGYVEYDDEKLERKLKVLHLGMEKHIDHTLRCSFQAKAGHVLVHNGLLKDFEYIPIEEAQSRRRAAQEQQMEVVLGMYDRGVKGDELYAALDDLTNIDDSNAKALTLAATVAFSRINDGEDAKLFYESIMEDLRCLTGSGGL